MSITDGTVYCARCGEDRTTCPLCEDIPPALVTARTGSRTRTETAERPTTITLAFAQPLPAKPWKWRSASVNGGGERTPKEMETSHLFYTLRMIWNHVMPPTKKVGGTTRRYEFGPFYTTEYMKEAVRRIGHELSRRNDLEPWMREQLDAMARHVLDGAIDQIGAIEGGITNALIR